MTDSPRKTANTGPEPTMNPPPTRQRPPGGLALQGWNLTRTARAFALAATGLSAMVLWTWASGVGDLLTFSPQHVPMAPSTAILLGALGFAIFLFGWRPEHPAAGRLARGTIFLSALAGALSCIRPLFGGGSPLEEWLAGTTDQVNGIPLGQMSPLTGGALLALAIAFLLRLPPHRSRGPAKALSATLASAVGVFGALIAGSYALGGPWRPSDSLIPMALPTALGFLFLAFSLLGTPSPPDPAGAPSPTAPRIHSPETAALAVAAFLTCLIALAGGLYLRHTQSEYRTKTRELLKAVGNMKAEEILAWREERLNDARFFARAPFVARDVRAFLANPSSATARVDLLNWLTLLKGGRRYAVVALLDTNAAPRLVVEDLHRPSRQVPRDLAARALQTGEVTISDLERDMPDEDPHLDIVFPVLGPAGDSGRRAPLGTVLLRIDPQRFLYPLILAWSTPSRTAESLLLRRQGNKVLCLNELRHQPDCALKLRLTITPGGILPAEMARVGPVEGLDYRGVPVLADLRSIPHTPWFLLAKIDREEIYAPLRQQAWLTLGLTALLALASGLMMRLSWVRRERASEAARLSLAERYRFLFGTMLSGFAHCRMIYEGSAPRDFVYLDVNPAFERLTGLKDVIGKRVTRIIPGIRESNPEIFEVYGRVAHTGKPEQLETFLPSLGIWFSVTVYCPEKGHFVAVFEDVSQRKAHEREIARLTRLYATLSEINQTIVRVHSREELFREVCRVTAEHAGFEAVWIGWLDPRTQEIAPVAQAGLHHAYVEGIKAFANENPEGRGPIGTCIGEKRICLSNDFLGDPSNVPWRDAAVVHGLRAAAALPIRLDGEVCGAFAVYSSEANVFRDKEVALLEEAAADISFALDHLAQEDRRRAAEAHMALQGAALEAAANAIMITGPNGAIQWANPAFSALTGYSLDEVIGRNPRDLLKSGSHDAAFYQGMWQTIVDGKVWRGELVNRRKDGSLYDEDMTITPVKDAAGAIHHFVAIKQDISERKNAEEALRVSEEQFRAIFETATVGIAQADPSTGRFALVNPRMCAITGYSPDELLRLRVPDITHPADRDVDWEAFQRVIRGENRDYHLEKRYLRKDGAVAWVSVNMTVLRDTHGKPSRTLATIEDITGRKQMEVERELSVQLLILFNESSDLHEMMRGVTKLLKEWLGCDAVGIRLQEGDDFPYFETRGFPAEFIRLENVLCARDGQGRTLRDEKGNPVLECMCGNVLCRRFDASKPFFTARGSFWTNCTTELLASTTEADRQARTRNRCNGEGYESVALFALRVGLTPYGLLQVNHKARGLFTPERLALLERIADSLAVAVAHRQGQKVLGESEERFRLIAETIDEVFWMTDVEFLKVLYVSPAYARVWGRSTESLYKDPRSFLDPVHPDDRESVLAVVASMKSGAPLEHEYRILLPDGSVRWIWNRGFPIRGEGGGIARYIGVAEDITARKKAEETLGATNRQLEAAMTQLQAAQQHLVQQERLHALGQMASGIAHDFNNALMPILGYTELLLKRPERLGEKRRVLRALRLIQTAASDAAQVVRRLREFYRHREHGEVFLPLNLNSLVQQTVELTRPRWEQQSEATGISIRVKTDLEDVPSVYGNEAELREALTNLIFNAVDSMPRGGTLTLRTRSGAGRVTLSVSDTGTGMTEEVLRHCLEPFFSTKGEKGTGLGLSMVHGIARRHDGTLEVESAPGKGSTFTLNLSVSGDAIAETASRARELLTASWRILVADDDPRLRDVLLQDLREEGHRVEVVSDGLEAAGRIRRGGFDLVITDRAMPGMSGDQLAEVIKRESPSTRVVLLTGFGEIMQARGEHPPCVDLVVAKPISLEKLRSALTRLMRASEVTRRAALRRKPRAPRKP